MITREQFLTSVTKECNVCKHLHSKLTPESIDYRPSPGQRSTLELLRYLSSIGIASMSALVTGSWDAYRTYHERSTTMTAEEFPSAMDRQAAEIAEMLNGISDEDLMTGEAKVPTGETLPLGHALMNTVYTWLVAYKMQLFLYAKANGAEIGTANCWGGRDMQPRPKPAVVEETVTEESAA